MRDLTPQNEDERYRADLAVYEERQLVEGDALVEALTEREKLLVEAAWRAGGRQAQETLKKALASPHAVTLDAATVRTALERWGFAPSIYSRGPKYPGQHYDRRLVALVRGVDYTLEQIRAAEARDVARPEEAA